MLKASWMWADASLIRHDAGLFGHDGAKRNPLRWSSACSIEKTIHSLETYKNANPDRPVKVWLQFDSQAGALNSSGVVVEFQHVFVDASRAIARLQDFLSASKTVIDIDSYTGEEDLQNPGGAVKVPEEDLQNPGGAVKVPARMLLNHLAGQSLLSVTWTSGAGEHLQNLKWRKLPSDAKEGLHGDANCSAQVYAYRQKDKQEREIKFESISESKALVVLFSTVHVHGENASPAEHDVIGIVDSFRLKQADVRREESAATWPPEGTISERCSQCICCAAKSRESCRKCGLMLCSQCVSWHPVTAGSNATKQISTCHLCNSDAEAYSQVRETQRNAVASDYRAALAGSKGGLLPVHIPKLERADDCAACGVRFNVNKAMMMQRRHHCRACGRSLCATCLCGSFTCMGTPFSCPHKGNLPQYGYEEEVKICKECLPINKMRTLARSTLKSVAEVGMENSEHHRRVSTFLLSPENLPLYEQEYEDTVSKKITRVGNLAVDGLSFVTPFVSLPYAIGANVVSAAWKHGQYGLACLLFSNEIFEGLMILQSMSSAVQGAEVKDLLVGAMYLSAEQRYALRTAPDKLHNEAMESGKPVDSNLLDLLIEFSGIGLCVPYQESAFEAQRLALQQRWRLITERLSTSRKHRPAWCLYIHEQRKVACVTIRGTDLEKSIGGDLFTDVNAMPTRATGVGGVSMLAHSGMLESARMLERELRPTMRLLCCAGYKITILGHSLGAGVSALLIWLLKNGADGEMVPRDAQLFGVGYATPSVVDRQTAEAMKPYFVTVINSFDLVPRLSVFNIKRLSDELATCAKNSKSDLGEDAQAVLDRAAGLWAPRLRTGRQGQPVRKDSIDAQANVLPAPLHSQLRTLTRRFTAQFTGESLLEYGVSQCTPRTSSLGDFRMLPVSGFSEIYKHFPASRCVQDSPVEEEEAKEEKEGPVEEPRIIECGEGSVLRVYGGAETIQLAWYGDGKRAWQENAGKMCTEEVINMMGSNFSILVSNELVGDPCPGTVKKLFVLTKPVGHEFDLFAPGRVVWIYRCHGSLQAAEVPCDIPSLRRIIFDKRMVADHKASSYHTALQSARQHLKATKTVVWQSFAEAEYCPCCHNAHGWHKTGKSTKQKWLAMTNCRACGLVVCTECATKRQAIPEAGILTEQRVCDQCHWRGQGGPNEALLSLSAVFNSNASDGASPPKEEG